MELELGPGEEGRRRLRALIRLQACVRGYLWRKQFQSLRAEYEAVVKEIEGDLDQLEWRGQYLLRPVFVEKPVEVKCSTTQETVSSDKASTEKLQEEKCLLEASEPERDWGCGSNVKPTAELQSEEVTSKGEGDEVRPNIGADTDKSSAKGCSAPAEGEERKNNSSVSSVWDSTVLETESPGASLEIPLEDFKELPRTVPGLLSYRNDLIMELLWLQQAIVSRKNYLRLKKKLATPDP
ncbi:IQ domain-containing protein C isoform X2 [Apteryx rowi]|uniref:IQ domain-containing protein C isoform X2 n=1 Tax=Apteryx rowi TaxID=308060 RepID=UPI000E1CAA70|nr:IQ domain-containing protein C isoform X2 [Apteryx rowi]